MASWRCWMLNRRFWIW